MTTLLAFVKQSKVDLANLLACAVVVPPDVLLG